MKTHTMVKIGNYMNRERAEGQIEKLKEMTKGNFHDFKYYACPIGGSFDLMVETEYYTTEDAEEMEITTEQMLLEDLMFALIHKL